MSEFFKCPGCKENCKTINHEKKCLKCGWNERNRPISQRRLTYEEEKEERDKKLMEMTRLLIPSPHPKLLFTEKDLKSVGYSLEDDEDCWGWADGTRNILRISNHYPKTNSYALHRRQFTNTTAHETAHLSPKRAMNFIDFLNRWFEAGLSEGDLAEWIQSCPDEARDLANGFPNNCVPERFVKESFKGNSSHIYIDWRGNEIINFGADEGHGWEWFNEFQTNKGLLYGTYHGWINDERQPQPTNFKYPTFSAGWFRRKKYEKETMFRTYQELELFGDEFWADEDEDLKL